MKLNQVKSNGKEVLSTIQSRGVQVRDVYACLLLKARIEIRVQAESPIEFYLDWNVSGHYSQQTDLFLSVYV